MLENAFFSAPISSARAVSIWSASVAIVLIVESGIVCDRSCVSNFCSCLNFNAAIERVRYLDYCGAMFVSGFPIRDGPGYSNLAPDNV